MTKREAGLGLLDIAEASEFVQIGNKKVEVKGISARGVVSLFTRFPELQKWMAGGGLAANDAIGVAPHAIAAVIAAGIGFPEDEDQEDAAGNLPVEAQLDLLEAIGRVTFRSGFGPFVERIVALTNIAVAAKISRDGAVTATTSQPASKPLSPTDTPPTPFGPTVPAE
jgi:hypothetical protein